MSKKDRINNTENTTTISNSSILIQDNIEYWFGIECSHHSSSIDDYGEYKYSSFYDSYGNWYGEDLYDDEDYYSSEMEYLRQQYGVKDVSGYPSESDDDDSDIPYEDYYDNNNDYSSKFDSYDTYDDYLDEESKEIYYYDGIPLDSSVRGDSYMQENAAAMYDRLFGSVNELIDFCKVNDITIGLSDLENIRYNRVSYCTIDPLLKETEGEYVLMSDTSWSSLYWECIELMEDYEKNKDSYIKNNIDTENALNDIQKSNSIII